MTYALELKNVTKNYTNFTLQNISLVLPKGCIMGLIGENGAGKSTLIKLMLNLIQRDGGEIDVLDVPAEVFLQNEMRILAWLWMSAIFRICSMYGRSIRLCRIFIPTGSLMCSDS